MTKPLTDKEFYLIGSPKEWGVLPVRPMGATVRLTNNRRILIRNTAEINKFFSMNNKNQVALEILFYSRLEYSC